MENQKGKVLAVSTKNGTVHLTFTNNLNELIDEWFPVSERVKPFLEKVQKGDVEFALQTGEESEFEISFIKNETKSSFPFPQKSYSVSSGNSKSNWSNNQSERNESIALMSKQKNDVMMRCSALDNASKICVARNETSNEQVLNTAIEFLNFLEK